MFLPLFTSKSEQTRENKGIERDFKALIYDHEPGHYRKEILIVHSL